MTVYGYARVSTADQDPQLQHNQLRAVGCTVLRTDTGSGADRDRPQLRALLEQLSPGDVVVVWKLDRLSRSLIDLLWILERIEDAGAGFRSVTESIDTTSAAGRMVMMMLGAFAEFEREMIRERTHAGLAAAKRRGQHIGRRPKLTPEQRRHVLELLEAGRTQRDVARLMGVGQATINRLWQRHKTHQGFAPPDAASDGSAAESEPAVHNRTVPHQGRGA